MKGPDCRAYKVIVTDAHGDTHEENADARTDAEAIRIVLRRAKYQRDVASRKRVAVWSAKIVAVA